MPKQTYNNFADKKYEQQTKSAFNDVRSLLTKADATVVKMLNNDVRLDMRAENRRFNTWFGGTTAIDLNHVQTRLHTMLRQLSSIDTTLTNDPASNDVAYMHVAPGQNFGTQAANYTDAQAPALVANPTIFIGKAFYKAPLLGKDSQVGTIIHELSHIVCSTEDVPNPAGGAYADGFFDTYGETNCKWLAANHPQQAQQNADNYLFYCCTFDIR